MNKEKLIEKINMLRASKEYISNNYDPLPYLWEKINIGRISICESEHSIVFIENQEGFNKIIFCTKGKDYLPEINKIVRNSGGTFALHYILKSQGNNNILKDIEDAGFKPYKTYKRMICTDAESVMQSAQTIPEPLFAESNDIITIKKIINTTFDALTDDLASIEELKGFIKSNQIVCLKEKKSLDGFMIFENIGRIRYLRCLWVSDKLRGTGSGAILEKQSMVIDASAIKRWSLWVDAGNISAIRLHQRMGFIDEKLSDFIFT